MAEETLYDHAKERVRAAADTARDRATRFADKEKSAVSSQLEGFAAAIEKAGEELGNSNNTFSADIVRRASDGLVTLSRSLNDATVPDLVDSVRRFGRENPLAFIGGAVLAGVALGRLAQSTGRSERQSFESDRGSRFDSRGDGYGESQGTQEQSAAPSEPGPSPAGQPGSLSAGVVV